MPLINQAGQKQELRKLYKGIRKGFSNSKKLELDNAITNRFLTLDEYKSCKILFAFVSTAIEVNTHTIIKKSLLDGKKVAVPKCIDLSGNMEFYFINSFDDLKPGTMSILEPDESICKKATNLTDGLCIVPGLCFDNRGYRLGFGGGYYDRFLENFNGTSVGICYSECTQAELLIESFDKSVDILITENNTNYTQLMCNKE